MLTLYPADLAPAKLQATLQGIVAPRPIALASTVDAAGHVNLSPFSFFNLFSANPPVVVFSPARRVRDNTTKHTLENVLEVPEVVIHTVHHGLVEQASLASTEYPRGVNEFVKAGLTELPSERVRPPRVAEALAALECRVTQVLPLGQGGGAGNLVVCEVLAIHLRPEVLDAEGRIDPHRMDLVARLGGDWYARASGAALFEVAKPLSTLGMGVDRIPNAIRQSDFLTGNDLGKLGNVTQLPDAAAVEAFAQRPEVQALCHEYAGNATGMRRATHLLAKHYLDAGDAHTAWCALWMDPAHAPDSVG